MIKTIYTSKNFTSTINDGPMSEIKDFYPSNMTKEEIIADLKRRRIELGEKYSFDGTKIIVPSQDITLKRHSAGAYEDVTERVRDILNDDPDYDLWNLDIPCDIMLIKSDLEGVSLAYPTADSPVVILRAKDTLAIAHCSSIHIDRELPIQLVETIAQVSDIKDGEINAYVGPCIGGGYICKEYPEWAKNDNWKHFTIEAEEGYSINLRRAVVSQLMRSGVSSITTSPIDTLVNNKYYSNYAYMRGNESKNGRFLIGTRFVKQKEKVLTKDKTR